MTPTKLSPEEIIALLHKLKPEAAIIQAQEIPSAVFETWDETEGEEPSWIPVEDTEYSIIALLGDGHKVRVTIPMPPLRRALRREELPEEFEWTLNGNTFDFLPSRDWDVMTHQDAKWSSDFGETWHSFFIDEPQPDLVVGGEGS